jgi:predicted  nucleic acid-binding Zn-ribbon protein
MRTAQRLLLLESAVAGLVERLDQVEQIRERLSLFERRLDELEHAHSDRQSALRDARERRQRRLDELKQTITTHKRDLATLTNTLAPANTRPDLHLVPAVERQAEAR